MGTMDWYCVDYWTEQLSLDIEALKREVTHYITVHPHVETFLQHLHASDKQVWLVTNAHQKSLDLKMQKTSLDKYFDEIVCSHDYGLPKEDPAFWQHLLDAKPYVPANTLLVEDSLSVLNSAREYGIGHLLAITRPDSRKTEQVIKDYTAVPDLEGITSTFPSS